MNEVVTKFTIDDSDLSKIDNFEKRLKNIGSGNLGRTTSTPKIADPFLGLDKSIDSAQRKAVGLQSQFQKFSTIKGFEGMNASAKNFGAEAEGLFRRLRNIETLLKANPRGQFLTSLQNQAAASIAQLKVLEKELLNIKSKNVGVGNSNSAPNPFSNIASGLPGGSIVAGALAGGVGGATAAVLTETIDLVKQLGTAMAGLAKDAVVTTAEFQRTQNSLAIFAGGVEGAKKELREIDEIALKTTGLGLKDAEDGYKRLRALGFQAEVSKGLIRGLAVQQQVSGASSADVDRVIVNLIQLSAGSSRASQDVRELIHAMPSLRNVLKETFGTIEGKDLGKIFSSDPTAFERFAKVLNESQQASGGLSSAITQLQNQYVLAQRAFAEPLLKPLTESVQLLAKVLADNKDVWKDWGEYVGNVIRGINTLKSEPRKPPGYENLNFVERYALDPNAEAQSTFLKYLDLLTTASPIRLTSNYLESRGKEASKVKSLADLRKSDDTDTRPLVPDLEIENKNRLDRNIKIRDDLKRLDEESFKVREALLKSHLDKTTTDELNTVRSLGVLKEAQLRRQLQDLDNAYQDIAGIYGKDSETAKSALIEKQESSRKIYTEIQINAIEAAGAIARKEREIEKERTETLKKELEERKKKIEDFQKQIKGLKSDVKDIFTNANTDNPFIATLNASNEALIRVRENTNGLSGSLKNLLIAQTEVANNSKLFGARLENAFQASDLRQSASTFRTPQQFVQFSASGGNKPDESRSFLRDIVSNEKPLTAEQLKERQKIQRDLDRNLKTLDSVSFFGDKASIEKERAIANKKLIDLTASLKPEDLTGSQRNRAASAREEESKRVLRQEQDARAAQSNISDQLTKLVEKLSNEAGIPVSIANGEQIVRIVNEAKDRANVTTQARKSDTNKRYAN